MWETLISLPFCMMEAWLFKLECEENKYFHLFMIIKELIFISGNALTKSKLFMEVKVYFLFF